MISFPLNRLRTKITESFSRKTKGNIKWIFQLTECSLKITKQCTHAANVYMFFFFEGITASKSAFFLFPSTSLTAVIFSRCFLISLSLVFALSMSALAASISRKFLAPVAFDRRTVPSFKWFSAAMIYWSTLASSAATDSSFFPTFPSLSLLFQAF